MATTIYHNPRCNHSRAVLAMIRDAGIEPAIVDYQSTPPSAAKLRQLLRDAGLSPRQAIRDKEAAYADRGLDDPTLDDEAVIAAMVADPILIQRPLVENERGVRLCRPPERVLELLGPD